MSAKVVHREERAETLQTTHSGSTADSKLGQPPGDVRPRQQSGPFTQEGGPPTTQTPCTRSRMERSRTGLKRTTQPPLPHRFFTALQGFVAVFNALPSRGRNKPLEVRAAAGTRPRHTVPAHPLPAGRSFKSGHRQQESFYNKRLFLETKRKIP